MAWFNLFGTPQPANFAPPSVQDSSQMGTDTAMFALANHTHASKVRRQRVTGVNTSTYTWTYPTPYAAGAVPIISAIAEDPLNVATDTYNVQVVGVPSATQCQLRITRLSSGLLALLLGALSINTNPGNINLHLVALEP